MLEASEYGLAFTAQREAFVLTAYVDSPGRPLAIGAGDNDKNLKPGDTITLDEAVRRFVKRAEDFEADLNRVFGAAPLTQEMFDALFSLTYNIGGTQLRKQTELISAVIAYALTPHDRLLRDMAAYHLINAKFSNVTGPFNLSRRCREALIFVSRDYGDLTQIKCWPVGTDPRKDPPKLIPMPSFRP